MQASARFGATCSDRVGRPGNEGLQLRADRFVRIRAVDARGARHRERDRHAVPRQDAHVVDRPAQDQQVVVGREQIGRDRRRRAVAAREPPPPRRPRRRRGTSGSAALDRGRRDRSRRAGRRVLEHVVDELDLDRLTAAQRGRRKPCWRTQTSSSRNAGSCGSAPRTREIFSSESSFCAPLRYVGDDFLRLAGGDQASAGQPDRSAGRGVAPPSCCG